MLSTTSVYSFLLEGARLDLLRSLPIFETHGGASKDGVVTFVSLASTPPPLLAPAGADVSLLPATFLCLDTDAEAGMLETYAGRYE